MKQLFILIAASLSLSGCVKLKILPDNAIERTFGAGVDLYDGVKYKKQGAVKREYNRQVGIAEYSDRKEAESSCIKTLTDDLFKDSPGRAPVTVSEKVIIVPKTNNEIIECKLVGYVWPEKKQ